MATVVPETSLICGEAETIVELQEQHPAAPPIMSLKSVEEAPEGRPLSDCPAAQTGVEVVDNHNGCEGSAPSSVDGLSFAGEEEKDGESYDDFQIALGEDSPPGINDNTISEVKESQSKKANSNPLGSPYTRREYTYAICVGVLLSFNAGFVNGTCLSGLISQSGRKVNVTSHAGNISVSALKLAQGNVEEFGFLVSMMLCFFLGSYIAGLLTPDPVPFRIEPTYGPTFLLGALLLTMSSTVAAMEGNENFIFYLASAANGIQNGVSTLYSKNLIRSTGLTGTVTDIGIFIGQMIRGNHNNRWKLIILLFLLVSFWLGGLLSLYATTAFLQFSLLVNAALFFLIGGSLVVFLTWELDISLGAAIFGTWRWRRVLDQLQQDLQQEDFLQQDDDSVHETRRGLKGFRKGSISSEVQMNKLFDDVDMDSSGKIDAEELYKALRLRGVSISKREAMRMMRKADKDGDGTLSREEWREIATSAHVRR